MATLMRATLLLAKQSRPFLCHQQRYLSTTTTVLANWNKDWKPGPIPRTPEERAAAAKKYGLRPEDYNCLVENETGDYPDLPLVAKRWRDPFEDYDMPAEKRNYGEPIHPDNEIIGEDLWDSKGPEFYTFGQSLLRAVLIFTGLLATFIFFEQYPFFLPQMPKQLPFNNLYLEKGGDPALEKEVKHYTFEPAESE